MEVSRKNTALFWLAVRESMPIMCGIIPFGITCGVMGLTAGLNSLETVFMSVLVFAGASQFIAIDMLAAGITGFGVIVFTTLLVNLRHLLIVPTLVLPEGYINLSFNNSYLCAGMVAAVIAWKTRNIFITLFAGMAVILLYIFFNP